MKTARTVCFWLIFSLIHGVGFNAHADVVYYTLDNIILADNTQMTGTFSWTFASDDFENGVGRFSSLHIPWTSHDHTDLHATFDITKSIEITLTNNVHDDGVDISLLLAQPLTPTTSSLLVLRDVGDGESKYDIGGNGFHAGLFQSGSISPTNLRLSITAAPSGFVSISWEPDIPGYVLQETLGLSPNSWLNSTSGAANPVVVPATESGKLYRLLRQ